MTYLQAITFIHTAISLAAIVAGFVAVGSLVRSMRSRAVTTVFFRLAVATSVTGYLFPFGGITPAIVVGGIALAVLAAVAWAGRRVDGDRLARWIYAGGLVLSLHLLVFVGIVQAFQKIAPLRSLAPTQTEPPFVAAQAATLAVFVVLGIVAALRFRPTPAVA